MTGYQSKKKAAQDKLEKWDMPSEAFNAWWDSDYDDSTNPYEKDTRAYWAWAGWKAALAQPEQKSCGCANCGKKDEDGWALYCVACIDKIKEALDAHHARERNFCERCGKRTRDLTVIHTCTPPQEGA